MATSATALVPSISKPPGHRLVHSKFMQWSRVGFFEALWKAGLAEDAIGVKRPTPKQRRSQHLCADAGYRRKGAMTVNIITDKSLAALASDVVL